MINSQESQLTSSVHYLRLYFSFFFLKHIVMKEKINAAMLHDKIRATLLN